MGAEVPAMDAPTYAAPAEPVFAQGPAATYTTEPQQGMGSMLPPQPKQLPTETVMGPVTQVKVPVDTFKDQARATMTMHNAMMHATREQGQPQYITGVGSEVDAQPQVTVQRQEQVVPGQVKQQIVEIPTVQEEIVEQEIPEVQMVQKVVEVPQVVQQQVEQIVEQIVEVIHADPFQT
eukprot:g28382.t1